MGDCSCSEIAAKTDEQMTEFAQSSDGKRAANLKNSEDEKALRHNKRRIPKSKAL